MHGSQDLVNGRTHALLDDGQALADHPVPNQSNHEPTTYDESASAQAATKMEASDAVSGRLRAIQSYHELRTDAFFLLIKLCVLT